MGEPIEMSDAEIVAICREVRKERAEKRKNGLLE